MISFKMPKFQNKVALWVTQAFGNQGPADIPERRNRFLEEALELHQACYGTQEEAHALIEYVYNRERGAQGEEIGDVLITVAALANMLGYNMGACAHSKLDSAWANIDSIRAKHLSKPRNSPLPGSSEL